MDYITGRYRQKVCGLRIQELGLAQNPFDYGTGSKADTLFDSRTGSSQLQ